MQKYLETGKIVSIHGLKGEVKIQPWCDSPEYLCTFKCLYSKSGDRVYEIERIRPQGNMVIAKLKGIDTPEQAQALRGRILYIDRDDADLPEGSYFVADLIGLDIVTEDGEKIGTVSDVFNTGSNDIYEVKREEKKNLLLPVIDDVVLNIDVDGGKITVRMMDGLEDLA